MSTSACRPRVVVLTLSFGSGHVRAAAAVAAAIEHQAPDAIIEVIDVLGLASVPFRAVYVWPYWAMLRYAPSLWRRLFASRLRRETRHTAPAFLFRLGCRAVFSRIRDAHPDVIVAAEVGACEIAVAARRRGLTGAPIVAVITDVQAEPAWVAPEVLHYAVPSESVRAQLASWGARESSIAVTGTPIGDAFARPDESGRTAQEQPIPRVLLMGGGMGPTRMDRVASGLCAAGRSIEVIAVTGKDTGVRHRLARLIPGERASLKVLGWTDDIPALMRSSALIVTKPGGLTIAEAAACGVPLVLFDPIPGPEEGNAVAAAAAGAAMTTRGPAQTVGAVLDLLNDPLRLQAMSIAALRMAQPSAAGAIARIVIDAGSRGRPFLLLTIRNGAGHTRAAQAIADALVPERAEVLDVADYFTWTARFTHVTAYLWLVRHLPGLWDAIDRVQKQRSSTSPAWFYRRAARRLSDAVARLNPVALAATEVGCCEIAALIKRDLRLAIPLVAVNAEYDADRAWVRPEVTQYAVAADAVATAFVAHGAERFRIQVTGVPVHGDFLRTDAATRAQVRADVGLNAETAVVLVAGGSEGLGSPEQIADALLRFMADVQVVLLAGRNVRLRTRACRTLKRYGDRVRVLGWTPRMADLMGAADVLVSKLGHTFDEALARGLPIVAVPPPPGAERIQYDLLREWGVGCPVHTIDEAVRTTDALLRERGTLAAMRSAAAVHSRPDAASRIARTLSTAVLAPDGRSTSQERPQQRVAISEAGA